MVSVKYWTYFLQETVRLLLGETGHHAANHAEDSGVRHEVEFVKNITEMELPARETCQKLSFVPGANVPQVL